MLDLVHRRVRIVIENRLCRENHSGRTEPTLRSCQLVKALLERMKFALTGKALDRGYSLASRIHDLMIKIRHQDTEKIDVVRRLVDKHVNLDRILGAL